jgi:probable HAF family extracellular repeat protein
MKSHKRTCLIVLALFASGAVPGRLAAQEHKDQHATHPHYRLIDLGTFGGSTSYINSTGNGGPYMNREGEVVGSSMKALPPRSNGNFPCAAASGVFHAMAWLDGRVTDLDSLGDPRNCGNALAINDAGEIVGASENGLLDPVTGLVQLRAVLWRDGQHKNLGTLGGNHSYADAINNRGQIVGFALNKIPDPFSLFGLFVGPSTNGTQTRAFLWENGDMRDLDTLGGPDAWALFVNESGQVAGYSYIESTPNPTTGAPPADPFLRKGVSSLAADPAACFTGNDPENCVPFLRDGEKLIDLFTSTIGGNFLTANAISDSGEVVGAAAFPNQPFDAAIWRSGVANDLGALPGDCFSQAFVVNSQGQITGNSATCDGKTIRAVLWKDGKVFDLNTLIPRDSNLLLVESFVINDRGEIGGNGFPPGCTDFSCTHAFVLIPCEDDEINSKGCSGDDEAEKDTTSQSHSASVSQVQTTTPLAGLTPSEVKDRVRTFLTNRNRRFGGFPTK